MHKQTKAILFSTLVFPGTGHYILRRWMRGTLFLIPSIIGLGILVDYQVDRAMVVVEKVLTGEIAPDRASIEKALREKPPGEQARLLDLSLCLIIGCWGGAALDVFLQGRKLPESGSAQE